MKTLSKICAFVFLLASPFLVFALDLGDLDGMIDDEIQIDTDTDVSGDFAVPVQIQADDTTIKVTDDGAMIDTGDTTITTDQSRTSIIAPEVEIESTPTRSSITTGAPAQRAPAPVPQQISVTTQDDTALSIRAQSGGGTSLSVDSIDLAQDGGSLIVSNDDVAVYADLASDRPGVEAVTVSDAGVQVQYQESGRLFGIFPVSMNGTIQVSDVGGVSIQLPWYSFLVTGKTRSSLETRVTNSMISVGSGGSNVYVRQAQTIDVVTDAVSVETNGGSVRISDDGIEVDGVDGSVNVGSDGSIDVEGEAGSVRLR